MNIRKRDGKVVPFDAGKIRSAVLKALSATGMPSDSVAERVAKDAVEALKGVEEPQVEQIQDAVETALMKRGLTAAAKAYILYRDEHARAREALRVRRAAGSRQSVTDKSMMIATRDSVSIGGWDRGALARALASAGLGTTEADNVAKQVEDKLIATGLRTVNAALVREMANSVMADLGLDARLKDETVYTVPKDFVDGLMGEKINENSNISNNNPEAVAMAISGLVQKQYLFDRVLSDDIAVSHSTGRIYVHDADFPTRVYAFSGNETAVIVKIDGYIMYVTLRELWDRIDVPEETLNEDQVRKSLYGLEVYTRDRGAWVRVEQLVLSKVPRPGKRFRLSGDLRHVVTNEHAVVVLRDGKYVLTRADEVRITDRLVVCKNN